MQARMQARHECRRGLRGPRTREKVRRAREMSGRDRLTRTFLRMGDPSRSPSGRWLNRTVLGIGLASLFSDWAHETATAVLPPFLASLGAAPGWLGLIEGAADGLSSLAKLASGYYTDRLRRRKPVAVAGYFVTALGTAAFGLATSA